MIVLKTVIFDFNLYLAVYYKFLLVFVHFFLFCWVLYLFRNFLFSLYLCVFLFLIAFTLTTFIFLLWFISVFSFLWRKKCIFPLLLHWVFCTKSSRVTRGILSFELLSRYLTVNKRRHLQYWRYYNLSGKKRVFSI